MPQESIAGTAERMSRQRAIVLTLVAVVYLASSVLAAPDFGGADEPQARRVLALLWGYLTVILLLLVGGAGVPVRVRGALRALLADEVTLHHRQRAIAVGWWVAMAAALALHLLPALADLSARQATHVVVTASLGAATFAFGWQEWRANRDG